MHIEEKKTQNSTSTAQIKGAIGQLKQEAAKLRFSQRASSLLLYLKIVLFGARY